MEGLTKTYIYTLTCPIRGDVFYVGKTKNLKDRKDKHSRVNKRCPRKLKSYLTFLEKNNEKANFEVIDEIFGEWDWLEQYWISQFKTWGFKLMNHTDGGERNFHFKQTEETKQKISKAQMGRTLSKSWCENISKGKMGLKRTEEQKINFSKILRDKSDEYFKIPIYQIDVNFNIINKYDSAHAIYDTLGFRSSSIVKACKGVYKSMYGFHWSYVFDYDPLNVERFIENREKPIIKIDIKTGEIVDRYLKMSLAASENKCRTNSMCRMCNSKKSSHNGYIFLFEEDYSIELYKGIKSRLRCNYKLLQIDFDGNIIAEHNSIEEAQDKLKIRHISSVCSGKRKSAGGYYWKKEIF